MWRESTAEGERASRLSDRTLGRLWGGSGIPPEEPHPQETSLVFVDEDRKKIVTNLQRNTAGPAVV